MQFGVTHVFATLGQRGARPVSHVKQLLLDGLPAGAAVMAVRIFDGGAAVMVGPLREGVAARQDDDAVKVSVCAGLILELRKRCSMTRNVQKSGIHPHIWLGKA